MAHVNQDLFKRVGLITHGLKLTCFNEIIKINTFCQVWMAQQAVINLKQKWKLLNSSLSEERAEEHMSWRLVAACFHHAKPWFSVMSKQGLCLFAAVC